MDCDWILLKQDKSRAEAKTVETALPRLNDGKFIDGVGYEVVFVATDLVSNTNPLILAVEHL